MLTYTKTDNLISLSKTNTKTNIFGLIKNGRIQIQIYLGWQKRANTNTNMNIRTGICKYEYKYFSQTGKHSVGNYLTYAKPNI